jgi:hypothetical protein
VSLWSELVGKKFRGWSQKHNKIVVFVAESFEPYPGHGFWMINIEDKEDRHDVSERAIGRTFHQVFDE